MDCNVRHRQVNEQSSGRRQGFLETECSGEIRTDGTGPKANPAYRVMILDVQSRTRKMNFMDKSPGCEFAVELRIGPGWRNLPDQVAARSEHGDQDRASPNIWRGSCFSGSEGFPIIPRLRNPLIN